MDIVLLVAGATVRVQFMDERMLSEGELAALDAWRSTWPSKALLGMVLPDVRRLLLGLAAGGLVLPAAARLFVSRQ